MATPAAHRTTNKQANPWTTVTLNGVFEETGSIGLPGLSAPQVDYAVTTARAAGVPDAFTFRIDGGTKHSTAADAFFHIYGDRLLGALFAALENA